MSTDQSTGGKRAAAIAPRDQRPATFRSAPLVQYSRVARRAALPALMIAAALGLRLWIVASGLPTFDSDEGTMGLMALHILGNGAHPIFFYGQAYMGALEAYLGAVSFWLFGVSDVSVRLGPILLTGVFLWLAYLLVGLLHGRRYALLSLGFLCLGSQEIVSREIKAVGGYPEILAFGTACLVLASYLAIPGATSETNRRVSLFGLWGLVAGLGLWSDPLTLPFVLTSGGLLLLVCRREAQGLAGLCALLGLAAGLLPLAVYNLSVGPGQGTLASVLSILRAGGTGHTVAGTAPIAQRIAGLLAVSLPFISGGNGLCGVAPQAAWPLSGHAGGHTVACTAVHVTWSLTLTALWLAAAVSAAVPVWRLRYRLRNDLRSPAQPAARELARLSVLGAAGMTVVLYCLSPAPAHGPTDTVRYLTGTWIALPEVLFPLAAAGSVFGLHSSAARAVRIVGLGIVGVALAAGTFGIFGGQGYASWINGQLRQTEAILLRSHVSHVYTDYWTCDWLAFETRERITCAVLDGRLYPSLDRYPPYRAAVRGDPAAWYVFRAGTDADRALARLAARSHGFRAVQLPAFSLYAPRAAGRARLDAMRG